MGEAFVENQDGRFFRNTRERKSIEFFVWRDTQEQTKRCQRMQRCDATCRVFVPETAACWQTSVDPTNGIMQLLGWRALGSIIQPQPVVCPPVARAKTSHRELSSKKEFDKERADQPGGWPSYYKTTIKQL